MKIHNAFTFKKLRAPVFLFLIATIPAAILVLQTPQNLRQNAAALGQPVVQEERAISSLGGNHFPSLSISDQKIYISWSDINAANITERPEESGTFVPTKLGSAGNKPFYFTTNTYTSNDGTLHYTWIDNGTAVHYRRKLPGQAWSADATIATNQVFANHIALFANQNTVIAVWRLENGQLMFTYSTNNGTSWAAVSSITGATSYTGVPDMAAAPDGAIYLVWNSSDLNIHLGQWNGSNFSNTVAIQGNRQFFNPSIAISPQGKMYISTRHATGPFLAERQPNGTWSNINVSPETNTNGAGRVALASDANGNVHLAWSAILNGISTVKYVIKPPDGTFSAPIILSGTDSQPAFKSNVNLTTSAKPTYTLAHVAWDSGPDMSSTIRYARVATPLSGSPLPPPGETFEPPQVPVMGSTKLGLFTLIPCPQYDVAVEGGPRIVKIAVGQDAHPDVIALIKKYKQRYPSGIAILRVYDNTGVAGQIRYYKTNDPVASARDYYNTFIKPAVTALKSRGDIGLFDYITGDNEFTAFDFEQGRTLAYDNADSWEWYGKFWGELAVQIKIDSGKKPLVGQIPVGNPINLAFLDRMIPSLTAISQLDGALSYHGYTRQYTTDVAGETDNDSLMYRRIHDYMVSKGGPSSLEFIIGEAGVDAPGGWRQFGEDKTRYQNWLTWYDGQMKQDAYVLGAAVFQMCDELSQHPWASFNLAPIADWLKTYFGGTPASTPTPTPGGDGGPPPPPLGESTIVIRLRNQQGQPVVVNTGSIFVGTPGDSDNYNLGGAAVQDRCSKNTAVGEYQCVKYPASWYAGMLAGGAPSGFCIVDGGIREDEGDSPLAVANGGTITVDVILRAGNCGQGGPPPLVPSTNCLNIQGPTTIRLGQPATYLTQYSALTGNVKAGLGAIKTDVTSAADPTAWSWNPDLIEIPDRSGSRSFTWTPTEEGTYQIFCRAISVNNGAECRGAQATLQSPITACSGPSAGMVVNVTKGDPGEGATSDMCSQIVIFGSGTAMTLGQGSGNMGLIPGGSISVAGIAKPGYNIKMYTFAFYNAENQPADPKPISFDPGKNLTIDTVSNNINLTWDQLDRPDLNYGNRKLNKIQVAAFFTDALGRASAKSPACTAIVSISTPAPTNKPVATPTLAPSPEPNPAVWVGIAGIIIAIIVTVGYFFFT